jgi:hypothetical protein
MTPTEEEVVLAAGVRYFEDFAPDFRAHVEGLFFNGSARTSGGAVVQRLQTPLSEKDREFAAFLAVARLMADFKRQVDALGAQETL